MVSELGRKPNLKHDLNADRRCLCAFGQSARQAVSQPVSTWARQVTWLPFSLPLVLDSAKTWNLARNRWNVDRMDGAKWRGLLVIY